MVAILMKNFYYYKQNKSEILSLIASSIILVIPIYLMLLSEQTDSLSLIKLTLCYLLGSTICSVSISTCFEYYKEISSNKETEYILAHVNNIQYTLMQTVFYSVLNLIIFVIVSLLIIILLNASWQITFTFNKLILGIVLILSFVISATVINMFFISLVKKFNNFSVVTVFCNIILIFSGCYFDINNIHFIMRWMCYLNPYTYIVYLFKYLFFDEIGINIYILAFFSLFLPIMYGIIIIKKRGCKSNEF